MASAALLVGGLASSVLIANRALLRDATPAAEAGRSSQALSQLAGDLRHAYRFSERTASAVTFDVPDRNGDRLPETIRYWWSGVAGQPLMYRFNSEPAVAIAEDVQQFNLSAVTRVIPAEEVLPPPAPVVFETFTEAKSGGSGATTLNITAPSGSSTGKLLIAAVAVHGAAGPTLTGPADWQLLTTANNGNQIGMAVWWRIAGDAEPAAYTFAWTGQQQAYGWVMRFGGANLTAPVNAFATSIGSGSKPQCPSVTATEGYTMILRLGAFDEDRINSNNAGMAGHTTITVDRSDSGGDNVSGGAAYSSLATPISSGTATFTLNNSIPYITYTIAIAPQPAG
jgi:hypothetical protein